MCYGKGKIVNANENIVCMQYHVFLLSFTFLLIKVLFWLQA